MLISVGLMTLYPESNCITSRKLNICNEFKIGKVGSKFQRSSNWHVLGLVLEQNLLLHIHHCRIFLLRGMHHEDETGKVF